MSKTYSLRRLTLAAAMALVLLPLVALATGLVFVASANWSRITMGGDEVDTAIAELTQLVVTDWEQVGSLPFQTQLARMEQRYSFALEVRGLNGQVRFASPGVDEDGILRRAGVNAEPNQRAVLLQRGGEPLGLLTLWVWPTDALSGLNHALTGGLLAGALTFVGLLLAVLAWIRRAMLEPLQALGRAAGAVASGTLAFEVPVSQVQELNALGQAFGDMRDQLQASLERQKALEAERRHFIAAIGHDLRTPLSSVKAFAEGLRDGLARDPAKAAHYGQVILTKAAELERLVEDLFQYSRLDLPETTARKQPVDAAEYLGAALRAFEPEAAAKGVTLAAGGPTATLEVDPELFVRVINNLLSNALRHTPAGGSVRLSWGPGFSITVADTGEGIQPEELPHLFSPLHRADRSRSRKSGGAGLGLAIARRIVELHGGSIACESTLGEGTCFTITLPGRTT